MEPRKETPFPVRIVYPGGKFTDATYSFTLSERQHKLFTSEALSSAEAEEKKSLTTIMKMKIALQTDSSLKPEQITLYAPVKVKYTGDLTVPAHVVPPAVLQAGAELRSH